MQKVAKRRFSNVHAISIYITIHRDSLATQISSAPARFGHACRSAIRREWHPPPVIRVTLSNECDARSPGAP